MKHKFMKVFGVLATVAAVLSMLVSAVPVSAAAQAWEKIETPANNGQIDGRVKWVGPLEKSLNGDLYAAVGIGLDICDDEDDTENQVLLYKSTNFGRTWTKLGAQPFDSDTSVGEWPGVVFDIECSPTNNNVLYVTDGYDIYKSTNGGTTWIVQDNLFEEEALDVMPAGYIVSLAAGTYSGTSYVFAATSTFGNGGGGLYALQESIFVSQWIDLEVGSERDEPFGDDEGLDVLEVNTFPDFATSQGVIAVVSDYDNDRTIVTSRFIAGEWAENAADMVLMYNLANGDTEYVDDTLLDATMWFPSDFSSDAESGNQIVLVGINPMNSVAQGDVFQCFGGAPNDDAEATEAIDLDVRGQASGTAISDLDGVGKWADGDLLASGYTENIYVPHTWASQDGGITWFQDAKRPTGSISPLYPRALSSVRVSPNFATNGQALVGTHGLDCGLSFSYMPTDVCATGFTWNTIYFIATCVDQKVDMSIANDNTIYLTTFDQIEEIDEEGDDPTEGEYICLEAIYHTDIVTAADSIAVPPLNPFVPTSDGTATMFLTVVEGAVEIEDGGAIVQWLNEDEAVISYDAATDLPIITALEDDTRIILTPEGINIFGPPVVDFDAEDDPLTLVDFEGDIVIGGSDATFWIVDMPDAAITEENRQVSTFDLVVDGTVIIFSDDSEADPIVVSDDTETITLGDDEDELCIIADVDTDATVYVVEASVDGPWPDVESDIEDLEDAEFSDLFDDVDIYGGTSGTTGSFLPGALLYSAWRYMDTTGDGVRDWERVNSYSLYLSNGMFMPGDDLDLVQFDFVRTTPENTAVVLVDRTSNSVYRSTNRGNLWTLNTHRVPTLYGNIYSVLLLSPTAMLVGVGSGQVYYSNFPGTWFARDAFGTSNVGRVTDLRKASNGDIIAAAVGSSKVFITRSVASATNTNFTVWPSGKAVDTGVAASQWAFASPANDYATTGVIYFTSDVAGIYYRAYTGTSSTQSDKDANWYNSSGAYGSFDEEEIAGVRYLNNLQTAPGGPGITGEGVGMTYLTSFSTVDSVTSGIARVKGRPVKDDLDTRPAELIANPSTSSATINIEGLWLGPASVGSVILYGFGSDCNIWFYTDTLNQAVTGVAVPAATIFVEECPTCPTLYQAKVQWNALANVSAYLVFVQADVAEPHVYDALYDITGDGDYVYATFTTATSVTIAGFPSQSTFGVSVWGIRTGTLTGSTMAKANAVISKFALTSFGGSASFTTPPPQPVVLAPAAGSGEVRIRPTFQWSAVPNATSYTITVDDNADFASPVKTVTTTSTAYAWAAADPALAYSTTYYWRVTATTPAGSSIGNLLAFTTEAAPVSFPTISFPAQITPTVVVNVPTQPAPVITIPVPSFTVIVPTMTIPPITVPQPTVIFPGLTVTIPPAPVTPTPAYIWVIVAVGALLTLAVIILIIRTRRVV